MDNLLIIRNSLEKVLKAVLIKISNGDQISASKELIWYDDLVSEIFHLHQRNFEKFKSIVDPLGRFKIVPEVDLSKIDWSRVTVTKKTAPDVPLDRRLYRVSALQADYDLIDTYLTFSLKVWDEGVAAENFDVAWRAVYTIGNFYSHAAFTFDPSKRFNFSAYYKFFTQKIRYKVSWLISKEKYKDYNRGMIEFLVVTINVDHLTKENFQADRYELWNENIFLSLKLCIDNDQAHFVNELIRDIGGKNITPLTDTSHTSLHQIIEGLLRRNGIENRSLLKQVDLLGHYRPNFIITPGQFVEYFEDLSRFKAEAQALTSDQEVSNNITNFCNHFEYFANRKYKARMLQRALVALFSYLVFKRNFKPIEFAFDYSQPSDANATWSRNDLLFTDFAEILGMITAQDSIETEFMFYWPDRHGMTIYVNTFFVAILRRWIIKNHDRDGLWRRVVSAKIHEFVQNSKEGTGELEGLISGFEDLETRKNALIDGRQWPFDVEHLIIEQATNDFFTFVVTELRRQNAERPGFTGS